VQPYRATVAREGALNNPSPALGAGKTEAPSFVAAEAATTKRSGGARLYSGRLLGRTSMRHL
jgi:hypothetical protein